MSTEARFSYDAARRVGVITQPDKHVLRVTDVSREQFEKFVARFVTTQGVRGNPFSRMNTMEANFTR